MAESPGEESSLALEDPHYREAVIDLLGAIAYGEISAFERLAEDAKLSPTLEDKVAIAPMAATELGHVTMLRDRLAELGADPYAAMAPFRDPIDLFHTHTAPADWYEGLVKAYVGDGLAADFYREIAAYLDAETRDLIIASLDDSGQADFAVRHIRQAIADDPKLSGRLALWGRRLMGEALTQAQRVAAERDALSALLAGGIDRHPLEQGGVLGGGALEGLLEQVRRPLAKIVADQLEQEAVELVEAVHLAAHRGAGHALGVGLRAFARGLVGVLRHAVQHARRPQAPHRAAHAEVGAAGGREDLLQGGRTVQGGHQVHLLVRERERAQHGGGVGRQRTACGEKGDDRDSQRHQQPGAPRPGTAAVAPLAPDLHCPPTCAGSDP